MKGNILGEGVAIWRVMSTAISNSFCHARALGRGAKTSAKKEEGRISGSLHSAPPGCIVVVVVLVFLRAILLLLLLASSWWCTVYILQLKGSVCFLLLFLFLFVESAARESGVWGGALFVAMFWRGAEFKCMGCIWRCCTWFLWRLHRSGMVICLASWIWTILTLAMAEYLRGQQYTCFNSQKPTLCEIFIYTNTD